MTLAEVGYPVYVILPQTYMTLAEVGYPVYVLLPQTYMNLAEVGYPKQDSQLQLKSYMSEGG
jgi:hypothetical protein